MNCTKYFLVDNGSLNPEAILCLRKVAQVLALRVGSPIRPLGLLHSHKVEAEYLGGVEAESVESVFMTSEPESWRKVVFIPLFFGPSKAISDWLPKKMDLWKSRASSRSYQILDCLFQFGDERIAQALAENVRRCIKKSNFQKPFVALVDHGTPLLEVNRVREEVGLQLRKILDEEINSFSTCCMERRDGSQYDFNNPLLEDLLLNLSETQAVVAQLFLFPGRHAGEGGDLDQICNAFPGTLERTDLLGLHPLIMDILEDRFNTFVDCS